MRLSPSTAFIASLTLLLPAFPQVLTEHAAAAAGATIGTAAGKTLSSGMSKIFGDLDDTTSKASGPRKEDKKKPEQATTPAPQRSYGDPDVTAPAASQTEEEASPSRRRHGAASARRHPVPPAPAATAPVVQISQPPAKEPGLEDLLSVKAGTREEALTASLGAPSSRITIPEDGHLLEILRYSAHGELLGAIRVDNGEVVNVQPAGQAR